MHRWVSVFLVLLLMVSFAAFAGGRKANESREVSNPAGFTESLNIEDKKPGKWNIYLEAKDKGGNTTIAGPHNIFIDPESDLPIVRIINPQPNMHVQGNLNMVGTCIDDDGVAYIELIVTRGSDGKGEVMLQSRAQGADFWSFFIDTTDQYRWQDGIYTVTAWGVDINGLSGISDSFPAKAQKKHQVTWNLDRKRPEIKVTSHELGALVSGKVTFKGTVWDGNGIDSLSYSVDNGVHFNPVSLKYDKRQDIYEFSFSLDTKTIEDGPAVIQFKSRDKMRSEGFLSFLIFANNTGPDVEIIYPDSETAVNGIFSVAGYAMHSVGLASLSYKLGKDSGEIPLIIGNPWWVKEFDIRGQNTKSMDLEIRAVDLSGNVTVAKRKLLVDQDADKPKITLTSPAAGDIIPSDGMQLIGLASDNDGVKSIFYAVDGKSPVEVSCTGYFQLTVKDIAPGVHTLDVWAVDITDVAGPKITLKNIVAPGPAPQPRVAMVRTGTGKTAAQSEFYSGIDIINDFGASLDLAIHSGSPLQSIIYQVGRGAPMTIPVKGSKGGDFVQNIPIPRDSELGQSRLELNVKDIYGQETVIEDYFNIITADGSRGYGSESFAWVQPDTSIGDRILLSTRDALIGVYSGGAIRSVEAGGSGADSLLIQADEYGRVFLLGAVDGSYGPITLNLTGVDGSRFTTREYSFLVDSSDPELEILDNLDGKWVQTQVPLRFRAYDENSVRAMEFSIDLGSTWRPLLQRDEISQLNPDSPVERTLDISSLSDGAVVINLRLTDEANKTTEKTFTINKDTTPPEARLVVPISGARVNGTIRMGVFIKEMGKIATITYERPEIRTEASGFETEEGELVTEASVIPAISKRVYPDAAKGDMPFNFMDLVLDANEMPLSDNMRFIFTDAAGNQSTLSQWPFIIDTEMDLPVVQISLPVDNDVVSSDFVVSGVCFDDDEIRRLYWRMDDGYEQIIDAKNGYSINVPLSSMTDNEHSVTIYAEDIYGVKGTPVTRNFRVSLEEPKASLAAPTAEEIVGGVVSISGMAVDENGIAKVQVSLDNGNSYNDAEGSTEWTYTFNSKIIPDGNHAVFVQAWDAYGINSLSSFLINIDNSAPELAVDTPRDGATTTGPLYITGQVMDNMKLESVSIKLNSLEGIEIPPELMEKFAKLDALILEDMDLSSLPDGNYNVEVWAVDKAENISRVSRNIILAKDNQRNFVETLYPMDGEYMQGNFNLYGMVGGIDKASMVTLVVNGLDVKSEDVTEAGYFRFAISGEDLANGANKIVVRSNFGGREMVQSEVKTIQYHRYGPWVTVDTLNMGDFAYERPWLFGRAGYVLSEDETAILADKKAEKDLKADAESKKVEIIELSFNNGRTFFKADKAREKGYDWRYRLETQDMTEGLHYLIVRASMVNGETAVTRLLIQVDKTPPVIRLITPEAGGHYNNELNYAALANDDVELKSLNYYLRIGDKNAYEIPGFVKGLYFEGILPPFLKLAWNNAPGVFGGGATFFDVSMGLSFFDDNVKLQVGYGQMTQKQYESIGGPKQTTSEPTVRYGGHVLGLKILANIYTLPFAIFGGPDWEWLSASFALGANFSLFSLTQSGKSTWMSALVAQIEFPKVTIPKRTFLRTFSLFTEGQLWFVPTDVPAVANNLNTVIPHVVLGLRMYIF